MTVYKKIGTGNWYLLSSAQLAYVSAKIGVYRDNTTTSKNITELNGTPDISTHEKGNSISLSVTILLKTGIKIYCTLLEEQEMHTFFKSKSINLFHNGYLMAISTWMAKYNTY